MLAIDRISDEHCKLLFKKWFPQKLKKQRCRMQKSFLAGWQQDCIGTL